MEQLNAESMRKRIRSRVTTLIANYGEILDLAMTSEDNELGTTASKAYRIEMATQGMIRSLEDLLTLIQQMQEIWLFGKLDTLEKGKTQDQIEEDTKIVVGLLETLKKTGSTNVS